VVCRDSHLGGLALDEGCTPGRSEQYQAKSSAVEGVAAWRKRFVKLLVADRPNHAARMRKRNAADGTDTSNGARSASYLCACGGPSPSSCRPARRKRDKLPCGRRESQAMLREAAGG